MAYVDGAGSASWSGFRLSAIGVVSAISVSLLSPGDLERIPATTVPVTYNVDSNAGTNTDVELQVATDSAFTNVVSTTTQTNLLNGSYSWTPTGLAANTTYYWRARGAQTGTTGWAPWTATRSFYVDINTGRAWGFSYENVGPLGTLYVGDTEYVMENTGFQVILYAGDAEYVMENVGFEITVEADVYDYVYEGDVSTNAPTPHVWFTWKRYGFVGDEVWAYGHGFGNPQDEYAGDLVLRLGPDYLPDTEILPAINEWYLQEALPEAYGDDRKIYAGSDVAEPIVNQQVEIVRWVVPSGALPDEPVTDHVHARTSVGFSNGVDWLMYPTIPVNAAVAEFGMHTTTLARLSTPTPNLEGHPQTLMAYTAPTYVIDRGRAVKRPTLVASAATSATLGSWSTEDALADALSVSLGATRRWVADPTKLVAHPELGTGVLLWEPSVGAADIAWQMDSTSAAFVDPLYQVDTRLGTAELPAMSFDGTAWAKLTADLPAGPVFTIAVVAVLQAPPDGRGHVLSSFVNGTPDVGSTAFALRLESAGLDLVAGGKLASNTVQRLSRRPVVMMLSVAPTVAYLSVLDLSPMTNTVRMPALSTANTRIWLARSDQLGALMYPGAMDVLEVAYWDSALDPAKMVAVTNKLDGIYGVTG